MNDPEFIKYLDSCAKDFFSAIFFFSFIIFVMWLILRGMQYCGIV